MFIIFRVIVICSAALLFCLVLYSFIRPVIHPVRHTYSYSIVTVSFIILLCYY